MLRTFFGDPTEALEDRGDELRLNGFHREAAWYYRQALDRLGSGGDDARRQSLNARWSESRVTAFRQILDEAESMVQRGRRREALALLADAERLADGADERAEAQGRRQSIETRLRSRSPAGAPTVSGGRPDPDSLRLQPEDGAHAEPNSAGARVAMRPLSHPDPSHAPPSGSVSAAATLRNISDGASAVDSERIRDIQSDPHAAVSRYEDEARHHPESATAREYLAEALRAAGRPHDARTQYEAAYRRNPERLRLVVESARLLREELADPAGALLRLDQGCRRHRPTSASLELHMERLLLLSQLNRHDEALAGFAELLSVSGLDRGALLFNRAGVHVAAARYAEARADLEAAIELAPDNPLYRERFSDFCLKQKETPELALHHLVEALELTAHDFSRPRREGFSPDRSRLTYKVARFLFILERDAETLEKIEEALVICTDSRVQEALLALRRDVGA